MAMYVENAALEKAKNEIDAVSNNFKTKGTEFITTLTNTLSTFSGETKDILMQQKIGNSGSEVEESLAYFVETGIPNLISGLSQIIEANRQTIDESDHQLAEAISGKSV